MVTTVTYPYNTFNLRTALLLSTDKFSVVNSESVQFDIISKYVQDLKRECVEYYVLFHFIV